jgi:DNA-directed RNA polymerase subunit L
MNTMEVEIVKEEKNEIELKVDDVTVAEILRVYLNEQGIDFAAWRREHPTKPAIFKIRSSGKTVKKVVSDAVSGIKKDLVGIEKSLKK